MNKSERLLSAFAETFFYKELVFDDLCFVPDGSTELQLADLLINLGDLIIAVQLKSRNEMDQTKDLVKENKWLEKKCKHAKGQVKDTLHFIFSGKLPPFKNKRGQNILLNVNAEVIPLIVFENDKINTYPHLLKKHTEDGLNVNCMSFLDFQEMCRVLYTPIEIVSYLEYRKALYENHGEMDIMIFDGVEDELIITKPTKKEALVYQFLSERYGYRESTKNSFMIESFQDFLHLLPDHTIESSEEYGIYKILLFLTHMDRIEITEFMKRLIETRNEARKGIEGICKSLRRADNEYAIFFVAGGIIRMEYLLSLVRQKSEVKRVVEVSIYWENSENFRVDFVYWDNSLKD